MNKSIKLLLLLAGFGILFVHSTMAGPLERFRQRLAELKRRSNPAPVLVVPVPVAPVVAPVVAPLVPANLDIYPPMKDSIWTGTMTLSAASINQYKSGIEQKFKITNPSVLAPVELWILASGTECLLVLDISQLKDGQGTSGGLVGSDCEDWIALIGTAPVGTLGEDRFGVLEGYDGSSSFDSTLRTFIGDRDKNNDPERSLSCTGRYYFTGTIADPEMNLSATLTLQNNNNDGLRIPGIANIQAKLQRSPQRTVTVDKFKKGGFRPNSWYDNF